jgi:hypothetical protein
MITIRHNKTKTAQGSVLLITMGITVILGLGLASYLMLMRFQYVTVVRSQAWNEALARAEAGIDEALAQLNPAALLFTTSIDRGANGWSLGDDGMYHAPRRTITTGSVTNAFYDVAISSDTLPIIYATGYVTIPTLSATISRSIKVTTDNASVYRGSLAARANVDLKGNGISTDSFNSMDPLHSTNGLYYAPWRKANGDVASTDGIINVQNADIRGTLYTGPLGSYTIGANGSVGDLAWVDGGSLGLETGHYKNDFNLDFPPVLPPFASAISPASGTVSGTNYTWVLGNGSYMSSGDAKFNSGDAILVTGRAVLYVTGQFLMQGSSSMIIAPGASLQLYVGGANTTIGTLNNAGNCASFTYFGLPGNTSISLSGNDSFLGTIYAPNADLSMSGGGSNNLDYQGACAVNNVTMNGHFNFHFDENLIRKGPARGYMVTSWTEI